MNGISKRILYGDFSILDDIFKPKGTDVVASDEMDIPEKREYFTAKGNPTYNDWKIRNPDFLSYRENFLKQLEDEDIPAKELGYEVNKSDYEIEKQFEEDDARNYSDYVTLYYKKKFLPFGEPEKAIYFHNSLDDKEIGDAKKVIAKKLGVDPTRMSSVTITNKAYTDALNKAGS